MASKAAEKAANDVRGILHVLREADNRPRMIAALEAALLTGLEALAPDEMRAVMQSVAALAAGTAKPVKLNDGREVGPSARTKLRAFKLLTDFLRHAGEALGEKPPTPAGMDAAANERTSSPSASMQLVEQILADPKHPQHAAVKAAMTEMEPAHEPANG